jgi:hypothetical protein
MEKKKDESRRPDQKDVQVNVSGSVTGGVIIDGSKTVKGDRISINTEGGTYVGGDVSTGGGDFVGRDTYWYGGPSINEIASMFNDIYSAIDAKLDLNELDKNDLKTDVKDLQEEVGKGDFADVQFLSRRLRNIQRIAPDTLEVILRILTNPAAGFSAVVRKLAEHMQQSTSG